jgi:subtilisin-like proprotein convertase family protein
MGLIRTVVYVGIIGGIFAYSQTKDSIEDLPLPDVELPSSLTSNDMMKSSVFGDSIAALKTSGVMDDVAVMVNEPHDIRGALNEVVISAGSIDIQNVIQNAVDELDKTTQKVSK